LFLINFLIANNENNRNAGADHLNYRQLLIENLEVLKIFWNVFTIIWRRQL